MNVKKVVIFDIDGTLADNGHRQYLVTEGHKEWEKFFSLMGDDAPILTIIELCQVLFASNCYEMLIFSGRPERYRKLTEHWLTWNNVPSLPVRMRKDGDYRPDAEVKEEMLLELLGEGKQIAFVVDDRKLVVGMWRNHGIVCLQCAQGDL
jgi:phosphoglycolate phosphatase-like HAD superfamily hydrolase